MKPWSVPDCSRLFDAGQSVTINAAKAGKGNCQDKSKCTDKSGEGPLPTGNYTINSPNQTRHPKHPNMMYLAPNSNNIMHDRGEFFIHGWGESKGCITIQLPLDYKKIGDWANADGGGSLNVTE